MGKYECLATHYLSLPARLDTVDRGGAISSMISGGVWVRNHVPVVDAEHYGERKEIARGAMTELRMLIYQLRPATLEHQGLRAALQVRLEAVETRSGITVDMQITGDESLSLEIQEELFWIILEGLNNIVKHARARHVTLHLAVVDHSCRLTLKDDGAGFDTTTARCYGGCGLKIMAERLQQIGGRLSLRSQPGAGTTFAIEVLL